MTVCLWLYGTIWVHPFKKKLCVKILVEFKYRMKLISIIKDILMMCKIVRVQKFVAQYYEVN